MNNTSIGSFSLAAILLLGGCQSTPVGPRALRSSQHKYNQALVQNSDEQLLANIVRLRYRDNPVFVDVTTMTQTVGFDTGLDNNWDKGVWGSGFSGKVSGAWTGSSFPYDQHDRRLQRNGRQCPQIHFRAKIHFPCIF
jgi:hypothetical protein